MRVLQKTMISIGFTGEVNLLQKPDDGDSLEIATRDTRALLRSTTTESGLYNLAPIPATIGNSKLILGFDGQFGVRDVVVVPGAFFTPTQPDAIGASNVIRMTINDTGVFANSVVGDYFYLVPSAAALLTTTPADAEGFYRIISRGYNTTEVDVAFAGLSGETFEFAGLTANTTNDSNVVTISQTGHGLRSGDLITTVTAATIGGIVGASLSVTNSPVTRIDDDTFTYVAGATATSDDVGTIDELGTNRVLVTHSAHGFLPEALVDISVAVGFGGISSGDLTVSGTTLEVVDNNSYYYRASAAATSSATGGVINTVTKKADTWVEFEVSLDQLTTWTGMLATTHGLTEDMIHVFRSNGATPQLVDFGGAVSSESVDTIVSAVNAQIASGKCVKVSPQQLEVHSNKYQSTGTAAVLATIGNSVNLFTPAVSSAIQSHVAFSESSDIQGAAPVVSEIVIPTASSAGYPTRTYLKVDRNITNVTSEDPVPVIESPTAYNSVYPVGFQHMWFTGRGSGFNGRVYNNQTTAPYTGVMSGSDTIRPLNTFDDEQTSPDSLDRYGNIGMRLQDLPVNNFDSLVVVMDLQPTERTVRIPMAKLAEIQDIDALAGSGKGQVISFRLQDPEDSDRPFFDPNKCL